MLKKLRKDQRGFTLLEVMIAFAIMAFILSAVFITQSSSLSSSGRSRNILIATNLARNLIAQKELTYEGRDFDKIDKKQEGAFPAPNDKYKWKLELTEVDFSALAEIFLKQNKGQNEAAGAAAGGAETMIKMFQDYLKKSVRRLTLTIEYPDGGKTSTLSFTELLVIYDVDFTTGATGA